MRDLFTRSRRTSYQIDPHSSRSNLVLVGIFLLCGALVTAAVAMTDKPEEPNLVAKPVAAASAPIPQIVIVGHRMTPEQKRQFDVAEATAE